MADDLGKKCFDLISSSSKLISSSSKLNLGPLNQKSCAQTTEPLRSTWHYDIPVILFTLLCSHDSCVVMLLTFVKLSLWCQL